MRCPDCNRDSLISDSKLVESYCSACGLVTDQAYDYSTHWYGEDGTSYSKATYTKAHKGLGTVNPDNLPRHKGMKVSEEERVERNFSNAIGILRIIWGLWQVPADMREECAMKYRKMIKDGITHGRSTHAMAIASTFLICERNGIARNSEELAKSLKLGYSAVSKCLKAIGEQY